MIPIGDDIPTQKFPFITLGLIAANLVIFFYELTLGSALPTFFAAHGLIPAGVTRAAFVADPLGLSSRFVSSIFIHGGWLHIGGNMLYLWIFGDNVEDRLGHFRFAGFYLLSGLVAMAAHIWAAPGSTAPVVGASGAIAGILGAYLVMFPRARVFILLPLFIFFPVVSIPAIFALGFWFLEQVVSGAGSLGSPTASLNIAWWAHIGGFVAGMILVRFFRRGRLTYRKLRF